MASKRLVMIYHYGQGNEEIARSDYRDSFGPIKNAVRGISDLQIEAAYCPDVQTLIDKLEQLTDDREGIDDLLLHFSGHGAATGIPYNDWLLKNNALAVLIDRPKVKCCFFSSCRSAELVDLANKRNIPVVIGTRANDVENTYAISFQKAFYLALFESRTFFDAFEYAVITTNERHQKKYRSGHFTRGEGGQEIIDESKINALQIVFATDQDVKGRMLPSNFILEMNAVGYDKPFCLNWFDNATEAMDFEREFRAKGFHDRLHYVNIPDVELPYINDRGDDDPILMSETRLMIHCSGSNPLPHDLRVHLNEESTWKMGHYDVLFCLKNGVNQNDLFVSPALAEKIPAEHIFWYQNSPTEFLTKNAFIKALDKEMISFSDRKKITLNFDSPPNKQELVEITDAVKYVRIFFARNANERLINFLINWFKSKEQLSCPVISLDNIGNSNMNLVTELTRLLSRYTSEKDDLKKQFYELHKAGAIIVIRNRSDDIKTSISVLKDIVSSLDASSDFFGHSSQLPTMLFFLHDGTDTLPVEDKAHIVQKVLSPPFPIDTTMLDRWKDKYNPADVSTRIAATVKEIVQQINPEEYKTCCPSSMIEFICDELKIPRKQITGI